MINRDKVLKGLECCCSMTGDACRQCPYDEECAEMIGSGSAHLCSDALELLKRDEQTIESLERTIDKLTKAIAEQPEQKFFVDSDGKMTPLPVQKHGHWIPVKQPTGVEAFGYKELTAQEVTCSECGFTEDVMASAYLYCPECGAKMDEEVKQDET